MARPRHLSKAPIFEALFDVRAVLAPDFAVGSLAELGKKIRGEYPTEVARRRFEARIGFGEQDAPQLSPSATIDGYLYKSEDEKTIAQFRVDGFTLNRLAPYTNWESLIPLAIRLWRLYEAFARPVSVPRIAVRYINKIALVSLDALSERFAWTLPMPPELPGALGGYLMRVESHDAERQVTTIVTQALEKGLASPLSVLLDIDVFRQGEFVGQADELRQIFEELRQVKNRVFFGCLTDGAVDSYQ